MISEKNIIFSDIYGFKGNDIKKVWKEVTGTIQKLFLIKAQNG